MTEGADVLRQDMEDKRGESNSDAADRQRERTSRLGENGNMCSSRYCLE